MAEGVGGDTDGGAVVAEEDEEAGCLLGEWLVAKVVCILTIIKCFFINEKRIQEEEDGEKRGRRIGGRRGYCSLHGGKLVQSVSGRYQSEAMGEKQNIVTLTQQYTLSLSARE